MQNLDLAAALNQKAPLSHPLLKSNRDTFVQLSNKISDYGKEAGVKVTPYHSLLLPHFSNQSAERQAQILSDLRINVEIYGQNIKQGKPLTDSKTLTWNAIKLLKLRPNSDLFQHINDDHVVEIHDPMGVQMFRNLNFYSYCSYSIEELYCYSWDLLYRRESADLAQLLDIVKTIYTDKNPSTLEVQLPQHVIQEVYSAFKYQIGYRILCVSPLFENNNPTATVTIEEARLLSRKLSPDEEQALLSSHEIGKPHN